MIILIISLLAISEITSILIHIYLWLFADYEKVLPRGNYISISHIGTAIAFLGWLMSPMMIALLLKWKKCEKEG